MKKISLILALILVCTMFFTSCGVKKPNNDNTVNAETSGKNVENTSEVAKPLTPEEQKELKLVETIVYNLAMAKTREEIKGCVIQYTDEYADYVLAGFPDDDYIVKAEKAIEYKGKQAFYITVTCESDPEYIYSGIQLFSYTDDGKLLIDLDDEIAEQFCKEFVCDACDGQGYTIEKAHTSGGYDKEIPCEICDEMGFDFSKEKK